jgi:2-haloacid dehalogenase
MNKLPKYITFDAYGTLCTWTLEEATEKVLGDRIKSIDWEAFKNEWHEQRWLDILKEYRPYETMMRRCFGNLLRKYGVNFTEDDCDAMISNILTWGPYPDVPPVLRKLREYCKIVIISNSEDRFIEKNIENIGVPFDDFITAEQARAYKPSHTVFNYTLKKLGCDKSEILHVAQGFEFDIMPAHELGWKAVWINRGGLSGDKAYGPYDELPDLTGLPALLGIEESQPAL